MCENAFYIQWVNTEIIYLYQLRHHQKNGKKHKKVIHSDVTYHESGEQLRKLIGTGLLKFTDLRDDPEKFFHAHRVLARHAVDHGPGFWIR